MTELISLCLEAANKTLVVERSEQHLLELMSRRNTRIGANLRELKVEPTPEVTLPTPLLTPVPLLDLGTITRTSITQMPRFPDRSVPDIPLISLGHTRKVPLTV